ncbi:hypothetical protein [Brucella pituitosa]|uniref:hypothetical protein n=1 Tax=Brucella pituitosa TaxID=571256 RepID=UPI00126023F3|nr:hypothetical protein [Brucella pituitosa]
MTDISSENYSLLQRKFIVLSTKNQGDLRQYLDIIPEDAMRVWLILLMLASGTAVSPAATVLAPGLMADHESAAIKGAIQDRYRDQPIRKITRLSYGRYQVDLGPCVVIALIIYHPSPGKRAGASKFSVQLLPPNCSSRR